MNIEYRCRLCLQSSQLSNSHILPEFLYKGLYDEKHRLAVVGEDFSRTLVEQKGLRERLLCENCEALLNKNETYAAKVLRGEGVKREEHTPSIHSLSGIDYMKFRLFGLSVLWRSHESVHDYFAKVDLGHHAESLRQMLLNEDPGPPDLYPFFLGGIVQGDMPVEPDKLIMQPTTSRWQGHRCYRFVMASHTWVFAVSSHRLSDLGLFCVPRPNGHMYVVKHKLEDVAFMMNSMRNIARSMRQAGYRHMT